MSRLAVVIPAYKDQFLEKTLQSFSDQTNSNFTIYVGDDFSPFDLKSICSKFDDKLNVIYHRFDFNIGAKKLVNQWSRCIELIKQEDWIWLFSDDDLIDKNCVESFFNIIESNSSPKTDVYRFNTVVIDKNDLVIHRPEVGPAFETSQQMAYNLLLGKRSNSLGDHIFSKKIYEEFGGLIYTEYAQGADWAMSILFSSKNGINVIPEGNFYWRYSGSNISSNTGKTKVDMMNGHLQFVKWASNYFLNPQNYHSDITPSLMLKALKENLKNVLIFHFKGISTPNLTPLIKTMHSSLKMPFLEIIGTLYYIFKITDVNINKLSKFKRYVISRIK